MFALMLKLQYYGHLMQRADSVEKTLMLGKERMGLQKMTVGCHHQHNGHEFEQTQGGEGSLVCCSSQARKE